MESRLMGRTLFSRGKNILENEGLAELISRAWLFLHKPFFCYGKYYLYEKVLREDTMVVKPTGTHLRISEGKDTVSFEVFSEGVLAHITKVALTWKGREPSGDTLPYLVDFTRGEACSGGSRTFRRFRGRGFYYYAYSELFHYLYTKGFKVDKFTVRKSNAASIHTLEKLLPDKKAEYRYLKILKWTSWKAEL